jgi:HAE1 family hydrophobic/amphiphilic exporter-1
MVYLAFLVIAVVALREIPLEFLPGMTVPWLGIYVPYPGSSPEEVERLIARPVEEALSTIPGIKRITSSSESNGCMVSLQLKYGESIDFKGQEIMEMVEKSRDQLPDGIGQVMIWKNNTGSIPVLFLAISVQGDRESLSTTVESNLQGRILRLPGVAKLDLHGLSKRSLDVRMSRDDMGRLGVTPFEVNSTLRSALKDSDAGTIASGGLKWGVRIKVRAGEPEDLSRLLIREGVRVGDVAKVTFDFPEQTGDARINGDTAFVMIVYKESVANTVGVCRTILRELNSLKSDPVLGGLQVFPFFNQGKEIEGALQGLKKAGLYGAVLAVIVLFAFLGRISATIMVGLSIPASILLSIVLFHFTGISFNIVSMSGLIIGIGMLVDNAIVVSEAIMRHNEEGMSPMKAIRVGTDEIGVPVICSTLTTVIVFIPLAFAVQNEAGVFLREFGLAISYALVSSLAVSLTLIPLLASVLISGKTKVRHWMVEKLDNGYGAVLSFLLETPKTWILLVTVAIVWSFMNIPKRIESEGFPHIEQRRLRIGVTTPDHFTFEDNDRIYRRLEKILGDNLDKIDATAVMTRYDGSRGRANLFLSEGEDIRLTLEESREKINEILPDIPGVSYSVRSEGSVRGNARVEVSLSGYDLESLLPYIDQVVEQMEAMEGIDTVESEFETGGREILLKPDRDSMEAYGAAPGTLARTISFSSRGTRVGWFPTETGDVEVRMRMAEEDVENLESIMRLPIQGRNGVEVPIERVASVSRRIMASSIQREEGRVVVKISAETTRTGLTSVREDITRMVAGVKLPRGCEIRFGAAFGEVDETQQILAKTLGVALVLIFIVMASLFESLLHPFVIMFTFPFGAVGVLWTLFLSKTSFNLMSGCGLLILAGIVVNNAIVLLDCANRLRHEGMARTEAVVRAGMIRFRPILMTVLTTIFGLIPMIIGSKDPASVAYASLAKAVSGGLATATVLTLLFIPLIYVVMEDGANLVKRILGWILFRGKKSAEKNPEREISEKAS